MADKSKGATRKQVAPTLILKIATAGNKTSKDEEKRKKELEKDIAKKTARRHSMKSKPNAEKAAEKQKKFLSDKDSRDKRVQAAKGFFEVSTDDEQAQFFENHTALLLTMITETLASRKDKKSFLKMKEVQPLLDIVQRLISHKPAIVTTPSSPIHRSKEIEKILERCLHPANKHVLRLEAFDLLLYVLSLKPQQPEAFLRLFALGVVFGPFRATDQWKSRLDALEPPITKPQMPNMEDSLLMLEHLLNFFAEPENTAEHKYWFGLFREYYLVVLYPDVVVAENKAVAPGPAEVFKLCPPEVQYLMLAHLENYFTLKHPMFSDFWEYQDGNLAMEISRQTCLLPLEWVETSKEAMTFFRQWIANRLESNPQPDARFWKKFARNMTLIITSLEYTDEHLIQTHIELVKAVVLVFSGLASERKIDENTRHAFLLILLEATSEMLTKGASAKGVRRDVTLQLCPFLASSLFREWLVTRSEAPELWEPLGETMFKLTDWKDLIMVWRDRVRELTQLVVDHIYLPERDATELSPVTSASVKKDFRQSMNEKKKNELALKDPKLLALVWNKESVFFAWTRIFNILGDFNRFRNAENYELAMQTMNEVVELLFEAQEQLAWDIEKPVPLLNTWLTGLLEATALDPRFTRGKVYAYRILHRFFCQKEDPQPVETLSHFYRVLLKALHSDSQSFQAEVNEVVLCAAQYHLFSLCLPGSFVLVNPFMKVIEKLFVKCSEPEPVLAAALSVANSFICFPNHFPGLTYPSLDSPDAKVTNDTLRAWVPTQQIAVLKHASQPSLRIAALWGISVTMFEEMLNSAAPRDKTQSELVNAVLSYTQDENEATSKTALEVLSVLALNLQKPISKALAFTISNSLLDNVASFLAKLRDNPSSVNEGVVATHFYVLTDFLLSPNHLMEEDPAFVSRVFKNVAAGVSELMARLPRKKGDVPTAAASPTVSVSTPEKSEPTPAAKKEETHPLVDAAEALLNALINRYNNFPCPAGPDQMNSPVPLDEETNPSTLFLLYNDSTLLSLSENAGPERTATVTVRDASGRYIWNASLHYDDLKASRHSRKVSSVAESVTPEGEKEEDGEKSDRKRKEKKERTRVKIGDEPSSPLPKEKEKEGKDSAAERKDSKDPKDAKDDDDAENVYLTGRSRKSRDRFKGIREAPRISRDKGQAPLHADVSDTPGFMLDELLGYVTEKYPECLTELTCCEEALRDRMAPDDKLSASIVDWQAQNEAEDKKSADLRKGRKQLELSAATAFPRADPPSPFHLCRLLLAQLGYLTTENMKKLRVIDSGTKFQRHLHLLDKTSNRETIKFGLIYVEEGQEHQYEIFRNSSASSLYKDFASGLGWLVDLRTHQGFLGGMVPAKDPIGGDPLAGNTAYFYADRNYEIIFHEVVRMPTDLKDAHQLEKKKHIGNDIVNVIWTDHRRDYKPTTITSQFNFAHIIVYPLPNGLFRIQVFKKDKVELFGPLLDGMVISKKLLPLLVRQTAINANRTVRYAQPGYERPFPTRKALITQLERFKQELDFKDFFTTLFIASDHAPKSTDGGPHSA